MAYSTATIAKGCFGKVYKQKYHDTWAAVKKVPKELISKKDLERECEVYNTVVHPNIVKLLGNISLEDGKWIIPLEFIFGEDLETTIFSASKSKIQLTPAAKRTIILGMCEGLLHLHYKDVVHQDLKPENVMVEHGTNRPVIIDLGLAKFFRNGLNSAADMGNEAYSAPEVLKLHRQRDKRSDVWAMGKIIAELCARVRLYTPSVCPDKIRETLHDNPYSHPLCLMVEPDPAARTTMAGVMAPIKRAAIEDTKGTNLLQPSAPGVSARNRSPSPANRDPAPVTKAPLFNRDPAPVTKAPLTNRDPALNRGPSPLFNRDPAPVTKAPPLFNRDPAPVTKAPLFNRDPAPNRGPSPLNWERAPRPQLHSPPRAQQLHSPPRAQQLHPSPQLPRTEDKNKTQAVVPAAGAGVTHDFMKMRLYQEAAKDLPCNLPVTGRVTVRTFEEKDGEVETWEQREVVTRDGKIIKFNDVTYNSK